MVTDLLVFNSSNTGSRDLWWQDDAAAKLGYNVYRAFDHPNHWVKLNSHPIPGHFWRDQSSIEVVTHTITEGEWIDQGVNGRWTFRLPDFPYSDIVATRPVLSNSPDDVVVLLDGQGFRPAKVSGIDKQVWLQMDNTLPIGGAVGAYPLKSDGVVWQADYSGVKTFQVTFKKLTNFVEVYHSMVRTFYTVVGVGEHGELHPPGVPGSMVVNSMEVDKLTWEYAEMIRRNQWLFEQIGEPAYLMFRKTRGQWCECSNTGLQQARSACPICFGVGIVGGYFGPYDFTFVPPDQSLMVELNEGGRKVTRDSRSYLGPTPIVQNGDLIVRRNGERLVVSNVTYKNPRGILVQQEYVATLLDEGDTRYLIPINTGLPILYNPVVRRDPQDGKAGPYTGEGSGEPVVDVRTIPGKENENPNIGVGRTVVFGAIET